MKKAHFWRSFSLIALAVLVPAMVLEDAEAARRSGLAGNLLIADADDMFIFPQHNVTYANRLVIDMDSDASSGSASLIFGNESWALNFSTNRSDYLNGVVAGFWDGTDRSAQFGPQFSPNLNGPSGQNLPSDFQWFDIGFGWGDETPVGFRFGVGADVDNTEDPTGQTDNTASAVSIQGGITFNETTDLAAEIAIGNSELSSTIPDPDTHLNGDATQFAAGLRGFYEMGGFEWGYLGAFGYSKDETDINLTDTTERKITQFMAGWGPVWNDESEDWQAAGYLTAENQSLETDPTGADNNTKERFTTFPGFRFAAEARLKSWLWVRGGARSDYLFHNPETEIVGGTSETSDRSYDFLWTAGVSADWRRFRFDGAINEPWVHAGPSFLGQNEDLFAFASATYNWGAEAE